MCEFACALALCYLSGTMAVCAQAAPAVQSSEGGVAIAETPMEQVCCCRALSQMKREGSGQREVEG